MIITTCPASVLVVVLVEVVVGNVEPVRNVTTAVVAVSDSALTIVPVRGS